MLYDNPDRFQNSITYVRSIFGCDIYEYTGTDCTNWEGYELWKKGTLLVYKGERRKIQLEDIFISTSGHMSMYTAKANHRARDVPEKTAPILYPYSEGDYIDESLADEDYLCKHLDGII